MKPKLDLTTQEAWDQMMWDAFLAPYASDDSTTKEKEMVNETILVHNESGGFVYIEGGVDAYPGQGGSINDLTDKNLLYIMELVNDLREIFGIGGVGDTFTILERGSRVEKDLNNEGKLFTYTRDYTNTVAEFELVLGFADVGLESVGPGVDYEVAEVPF